MDWQDRIIEKWQEKARQQVDLAKDEVIKTLQAMWKQGQGSKGVFSSGSSAFGWYSESHGRRREKKGKQTSKVDLNYSGTLTNSIKEKERVDTPQRVAVTIGFTGNASRRPDQKDSITNSQLAGYLGIQLDQDVLRLTETDRAKIQQKYGVKITYD
jgi:hypothetical protein